MRVLVLDSVLARCAAAIVDDGVVVAERAEARTRGHETVLPVMARDLLAETRARGGDPALIAATVGPGSFTGSRGCLALAQGISFGLGVPAVGVTVGEAIADALPHLGRRALWTVVIGRRGHIYLERDGEASVRPLDALPPPPGAVAVAGPAAIEVAARLAATGADVMLTDARFPLPRHIAVVAERRHAGLMPPREAQPLYGEPPLATPPANRRPPPEGWPDA